MKSNQFSNASKTQKFEVVKIKLYVMIALILYFSEKNNLF